MKAKAITSQHWNSYFNQEVHLLRISRSDRRSYGEIAAEVEAYCQRIGFDDEQKYMLTRVVDLLEDLHGEAGVARASRIAFEALTVLYDYVGSKVDLSLLHAQYEIDTFYAFFAHLIEQIALKSHLITKTYIPEIGNVKASLAPHRSRIIELLDLLFAGYLRLLYREDLEKMGISPSMLIGISIGLREEPNIHSQLWALLDKSPTLKEFGTEIAKHADRIQYFRYTCRALVREIERHIGENILIDEELLFLQERLKARESERKEAYAALQSNGQNMEHIKVVPNEHAVSHSAQQNEHAPSIVIRYLDQQSNAPISVIRRLDQRSVAQSEVGNQNAGHDSSEEQHRDTWHQTIGRPLMPLPDEMYDLKKLAYSE